MSDRRHTARHVYRDVWLVIITGLALLGIWLNHNAVQGQIAGRHFAVGFTCAVQSAIAEGGRDVILGQTSRPVTRFERELEKLGYPPRAQRHKAAEQAAREYVQHISARVKAQVGANARNLIRPDGTIDCTRLQELANTIVGH
jgi:hypothetical protein